MDVRHLDYDDESLVRAALQEAYPSERPVFSQRRGAQIIRAAAVRALDGGDRRHPFVGGRVAATIAAAFTLFAGTAGAASAALPGEPLYPVKQAVERAMVAMTGSDVQAARLELRFAERRLDEAAAIPDDADGNVSASLSNRFNEHLNAAASLAGDQIANEVEQLEQSRDDATTGTANASAPVDQAPVNLEPQEQPDGQVVPPTPLASASPEPSPTPSPEPTGPTPAVVPTPSASPSPTETPGDPAQPSPLATASPSEPTTAAPDPQPLPPLDGDASTTTD